nr:immunoglobulin light chain junction region [Macaca mulatta]MOW09245.1 immunoglobulin light chain junction region [Macaca mulatta]MOW10944.1 immunoglobulin light chain junction region [Macaca mulatta]MOW11165.1 immunoglobulin light chain junction region [Macaca mulatta]MOW11328.1 immunoglobulin light chain junction region [Macaca mulatta]
CKQYRHNHPLTF